MKELIEQQRQYFSTNVTKPVAFRIEQLRKLKNVLLENQTAMDQAVRADFGKSHFENILTELYVVHDDINVAIASLEQWAEPKPTATNILNAPASSYIIPEPLGVSLIIGPWNYPFQLTLAPLVAAIAAGCTAIIKPSELTAQCGRIIKKIIQDNFAAEYIYVVEGGIPETTALLEQKFDTIFFTGSVPVGRIVYQAAAKHLTPVTLELGGKSPVVVMPDADLDLTVKRLVWGKFLNSGQTCIAPDYVYVHDDVHKKFIAKVKAEIEERQYALENGNYVQIINEKNLQRLARLIIPEKVAVGGTIDSGRRIIAPTVMTGITWKDLIMQEEIFGPLLPVMTFTSLSQIIREIKERPKPLALYLFAADTETINRILTEVSFGGGCVNDVVMHISNGSLPFGGVGESGMGSYHGESGFRAFSHFKSILHKPFDPEPEVKYSPYIPEKLQILESLLA